MFAQRLLQSLNASLGRQDLVDHVIVTLIHARYVTRSADNAVQRATEDIQMLQEHVLALQEAHHRVVEQLMRQQSRPSTWRAMLMRLRRWLGPSRAGTPASLQNGRLF